MRFITVCVLAVASIPALCTGKRQSSSDPVDGMRAVVNLPNLVLAMASVDRPPLRCLTADLTSVDEDSGKVTYTWHVKSPNSSERTDLRFNFVRTGDRPDTFVARINDDTSQSYATHLFYSDYKNCIVDKVIMAEEVCYLWESRETANSVPKNCLDAYKKSCGDGVTLWSSNTCNTK